MAQNNSEKIRIELDEEIKDLIPFYLQTRQKDIKSLQEALEKEDFETIRITGHNMKGSGYGFDDITKIGAAIEQSAKDKDAGEISRQIEKFTNYMERVEVVFT